jgi:uncharacterized protein GlcG (DUF336 family)
MLKKLLLVGAGLGFFSTDAMAGGNGLLGPSEDPNDGPYQKGTCQIPQKTLGQFQGALNNVVTMNNGGIFKPNMMWLAVVDRSGTLCLVIKSQAGSSPDPWPGSRDIAIAKASTANDFSNNQKALSTANLYGVTQPGGSLYGLNNSNPFNPTFNAQSTGIGFVPGGIITFGGGVALYQNGQVIGGLGVSGDTSCADHAIGYRVRAQLSFNAVPGGVGADNIVYSNTGTGFTQPNCLGVGTDVVP